MHYQHRNPMRARDHRIALMPIERTPPLTRREKVQLAIVMLKAGAYTVALFAVAAIALAAVGG